MIPSIEQKYGPLVIQRKLGTQSFAAFYCAGGHCVFAAKSNLDGLWGSRNSIKNESNWHENLYFNDAFSDVFTEKQTICNSDGIPTDIVLYSIAGECISVLPVKQLCRADFPSCRTVYFPPDKIYPVQFGQNDHDIAYLSMSWPKGNLPSGVFW